MACGTFPWRSLPQMGCPQAVTTYRSHTGTSPKLPRCGPAGSSGKQFVHPLGKTSAALDKSRTFQRVCGGKEGKKTRGQRNVLLLKSLGWDTHLTHRKLLWSEEQSGYPAAL